MPAELRAGITHNTLLAHPLGGAANLTRYNQTALCVSYPILDDDHFLVSLFRFLNTLSGEFFGRSIFLSDLAFEFR